MEDSHVRIERVALEDHADIAVFGLHEIDQALAKEQPSLSRLVDAGQGQQGGGLAAAGWTQKGDELAIVNMQGQVLDADYFAEFLGEVVNGNFHSDYSCFLLDLHWSPQGRLAETPVFYPPRSPPYQRGEE